MVYVKRDADHNIIAVFAKNTEDDLEQLSTNDKELIQFLTHSHLTDNYHFLKSDLELIRALEDLIQILIAKNLITITDFPGAVIDKLMARKKIREEYKSISDIMDDI